MLKNIHEYFKLGQHLEFEESTLEAIQKYYNNNTTSIVSYLIGVWLMHDPEDPLKQLSDALNAMGERVITTQLLRLSSLGKELLNQCDMHALL